jgi:hypothetical protein
MKKNNQLNMELKELHLKDNQSTCDMEESKPLIVINQNDDVEKCENSIENSNLDNNEINSKNINEDSIENNNTENNDKDAYDSNYDISFGLPDILFTLTLNNKPNKECITSLIAKIFIVRELTVVNLKEMSKLFVALKIDILNIIVIKKHESYDILNTITVEEPMSIKYTEVGYNQFLELINRSEPDFYEYNKNTLYIIKDGDFVDVKRLFSTVNGFEVNLGRGGSQKSHMVSPLELRLISYLLVIYNMDTKFISYVNTFNDISKSRYLPFVDNSNKYKTFVRDINLSRKTILNNKNNKNIPSSREYHTSISKSNYSEDKVSVFSYLDQIDDIIKNSDSLKNAQEAIETS